MFCKNCGSQLPDNATICPNCGANMSQNSANTVNTSNVVNAMPNQNVKQFNNKNKKVIGIAVGAVALVVVALILFATKKTTVNLNKYITVSFSGYDTLGRASYDFDTVAFRKDYKDKIILGDSDVHHIKKVMRCKNDDKIEVVYDKNIYSIKYKMSE